MAVLSSLGHSLTDMIAELRHETQSVGLSDSEAESVRDSDSE